MRNFGCCCSATVESPGCKSDIAFSDEQADAPAAAPGHQAVAVRQHGLRHVQSAGGQKDKGNPAGGDDRRGFVSADLGGLGIVTCRGYSSVGFRDPIPASPNLSDAERLFSDIGEQLCGRSAMSNR